MLDAKFFPPAAPFPHLTAEFSKNAVEFSLPAAELAVPTVLSPMPRNRLGFCKRHFLLISVC